MPGDPRSLGAAQGEKNKLSGEIGRLKKSGGDASALMEEIGAVSAELDALDGPLSETERRFSDSMLDIPNLPDPGVPVGESEADNPVLRHWGEAPAFSFTPKNHWEIGEALGILDFARGAKITGARFTLYRGQGALLERALIGFMLDLQTRRARLRGDPAAVPGEPGHHDRHRPAPQVRSGHVPHLKTLEETPTTSSSPPRRKRS